MRMMTFNDLLDSIAGQHEPEQCIADAITAQELQLDYLYNDKQQLEAKLAKVGLDIRATEQRIAAALANLGRLQEQQIRCKVAKEQQRELELASAVAQ